ncbi:Endoglucanase celA precursor [Labilithrix luteola]|uniref:Endoglucanase celA n=1 Tax=Labilithrix luteola TaxID=1391654 RepID=A0A0K1Q0S7_9BACT|nr:cellulase family glycosylhydrolase [Labilithrix luteola]AKU99221.1 Endoglucanase celA precursor [Labilithrix luteola]
MISGLAACRGRAALVALTIAAWGVTSGAACGRPPSSPALPEPAPSPPPAPVEETPPVVGPITGWLRTEGNHIVLPDGKRFHGRGANLHDTRSCDSCSWEKPHVEEVLRRIDVLVDDWHANFVRVLLESYADKGPGDGRAHYRNVLEDADYFHDVMRIVGHVGKKKGVYVLLSLWHEPSFAPLGWPSERTQQVWKKLASALRDMPFVMFGLVNEPERNDDGKLDGEVWKAMNDTVAAIRSVERPDKRHIVAVQGTREWGRVLDYYMDHPITAGDGVNIAYETHIYDRPARFDALVKRPASKLPIFIGEVGPVDDDSAKMLPDDIVKLWDLAESLEVPWMAYTFHTNCPPNLLLELKDTCGVGASLEPSPWGRMVKQRLAKAW